MDLLKRCPPFQDIGIIKHILKNTRYDVLTYNDIFIDETSKVKKVKKGEYLSVGKYPIIDQGQDFIGGYTNEEENIYFKTPFLIFGDHTRVVKYLEDPSFIGADGVKVLNIKDTAKKYANIRYLYYYLTYIDIPNDGYSRHFKYIKDLLYIIPPMEIQKKIVEVLDEAQKLIDNRKKQIELLDDLIESIFYDMFGDPFKNDKGWNIKSLIDVCIKITDGTHHSPKSSDEGQYKYITAKNIKKSGFDLNNLTYVTEDVHNEIFRRCNPEYKDILYIKDGATTGVAQINTLQEEFSMLSSVALLKQNRKIIDAYYLREVLNNKSMYLDIRSNMGGAAITRLTLKKIGEIKIPLPPLSLQNKFAEKVELIEKQKALMEESLKLMEDNYNSLMQRAFKGELF